MRQVRELVDGASKPTDWVKGEAAVQICQAIDSLIHVLIGQ
jgi:hypothetical protein